MKVSKNQLNEIQKDSKEDPSGKVKRYGLALQHDFSDPLNSSGGSRWSLRDGQGIIPEPSVEAAKEQVNQVMRTQWIDVDCNVSKEQVAKGIELPPQTCANFDTGCHFGAPQRLFNVSGPKSKPKAADT